MHACMYTHTRLFPFIPHSLYKIRQQAGVAFGVPGPAAPAARAAAAYTYLQVPTPGAANGAAKPEGPFIFK